MVEKAIAEQNQQNKPYGILTEPQKKRKTFLSGQELVNTVRELSCFSRSLRAPDKSSLEVHHYKEVPNMDYLLLEGQVHTQKIRERRGNVVQPDPTFAFVMPYFNEWFDASRFVQEV